MKHKSRLGFSLIELSIVLLIVAILMFSVIKGGALISHAKLSLARQKTANSPVTNMKGLMLWLETTSPDSFVTSETFDGASLSAWNDISRSNPNNPIVLTPFSTSPTYVGNEMNGIPAVRFDGFFRYGNFNFGNIGTGGFSVFTVALNKSGTAILFTFDSASSSFFNYISNVSVGTYLVSFGPSGGTVYGAGGASVNGSPVILLSSRDSSGNYVSRVNGSLYTSASGVTDNFSTTDSYELKIGNTNVNLYISEVIFFDRALSTQEIEDVEYYLSDKYGIKISS